MKNIKKNNKKGTKADQKKWWFSENENEGAVIDRDASKLSVDQIWKVLEPHVENMDKVPEDIPLMNSEKDLLATKTFLPIRKNNKWTYKEETVEPQKITNIANWNPKQPFLRSENAASFTGLMVERAELIKRYKIYMAYLSRKLLVNPTLVDTFSSLINILAEDNPLVAITIRKYAAVNLMVIFDDLLPGYIINKKILDNKVKREKLDVVKKELVLLVFYEKYLKMMESILLQVKKDKTNNLALKDLQMTVLKCYGQLLIKHPVFNHAMDIMGLLIKYLNTRREEVRKLVFHYITEALKSDKSGKMSLTVVEKVYKFVRSRKMKVNGDVLRVFLHLNMEHMQNMDVQREEFHNTEKQISRNKGLINKLKAQSEKQPSRKQKKDNKKKAILNVKISKLDAESLAKHKPHYHSETLQLILGLYFNILKKRPQADLLSTVFEGLAKFAELINIEFFSDLLKLFDEYLADDSMNFRDMLHCVETVFTILACQGEALSLDPARFYKHIYCKLPNLMENCNDHNVKVVLRILHQMLISRKRKIVAVRVVAFTKRLATVALSMPHHAASLPLLVTVGTLLQTFPCNEALLDTAQEGCPGQFSADILEPDLCNAAASSLYDLHGMSRHYHSEVRRIARRILINGIKRDSAGMFDHYRTRSTHKLYAQYDPMKMSFDPPIPAPDRHILKKRKITSITGELVLHDINIQLESEKILDRVSGNDSAEEPKQKKQKTCQRSADDFYQSHSSQLDLEEIPSRSCLDQVDDRADAC